MAGFEVREEIRATGRGDRWSLDVALPTLLDDCLDRNELDCLLKFESSVDGIPKTVVWAKLDGPFVIEDLLFDNRIRCRIRQFAGVESLRFGMERVRLSVAIGVCDVESTKMAEDYLQTYQRANLIGTVAISRTGLICRVRKWVEDWVDVEIMRLTVQGKKLAPKIVEPYLIGNVNVSYDI